MLHIIKTTQKKVLLPSLLRLIGKISVRSSTLETALCGKSKVRTPTYKDNFFTTNYFILYQFTVLNLLSG